ncbi:hypothetical protein F5148DRAFT_875630 [Russula earlei]|uniref:Uncharacterized protein n=1 Tax=Russula earlei TaxID=71964 RepID=A0ACC0UBA6_9AGAM|nr:hypothetical protein F5148DRAFT_875630 [Russula earlei]
MALPPQPCVSVAPCYGPTRMSPDAFPDLQLFPVDSQSLPSHESSHLGATVSSASTSPMVPLSPILTSPQPPPPKGWEPSPSDSSTTSLASPQDASVPYWPQTRPPPTQARKQTRGIRFTMPYYDNLHLFDPKAIARSNEPCRLTVFQLQELANGGVTAPPPGSIDIGMGMYPSGMSGSTAFDYPLRLLGEDPETFMSDPTVEQLLATINTLVGSHPQENVSPSSTDVETVEQTQGFDFDDFVKDFGVTTSQEDTEGASTVQIIAEEQSNTTALSIPENSPASSSTHLEGVMSPMPSFYVPTPSSVSPESTPPPSSSSHYMPSRDAANSSNRRVGGSWKVPFAVSRLASPIPSCT